MKKILALLLITTMLISALGCYINAGTDYIIPNPAVKLELSSPTVDGNITDTEGWYGPLYMDKDTLNFWRRNRALSMLGELHFAIDKKGIYVAVQIREDLSAFDPELQVSGINNKITPSTMDSVRDGRFDGDFFSLTVDPLDTMISKGYSAAIDNVPKYDVSFCEDGSLQVIREHVSGEDRCITDKVGIAGSADEYTMQFELYIPWSFVIDDIYFLTFKEETLKVENIVMDYSTIRAGAIYYDRYMDEEKGKIDLYNRYITAPDTFFYGNTPGHRPIDVIGRNTLGITLNIFELCQGDGHKWSDWKVLTSPSYFEEGSLYSYCKQCGDIRTKEIPKKEYTNSFTDVNESSWYSEGVEYCIKKGYLSGMGSGNFSPNTALTREQCVVVLANILNADTSEYLGVPSGFDDVPLNRWYSAAVAWAVDAGYVKGMSPNTFGTGQKIQRAAFARLLYFAAEDLGADMTVRADLTKYVDHDNLPTWAYDQLSWAVGSNIIVSIKDDVLMISPYTQLKRAQCATMLWQMGLQLDNKN